MSYLSSRFYYFSTDNTYIFSWTVFTDLHSDSSDLDIFLIHSSYLIIFLRPFTTSILCTVVPTLVLIVLFVHLCVGVVGWFFFLFFL